MFSSARDLDLHRPAPQGDDPRRSVRAFIPAIWPGYELRFRFHTTTYEIVVDNPHAVSRGVLAAELDGELLPDGASVPLHDDGATHRLRVSLGLGQPRPPSAL